MTRGKFVWRVVVDSWPTPDGKPFADQPCEWWDKIVEAYVNPGDKKAYPDWLPDIGPWLVYCNDETPRSGHPIYEPAVGIGFPGSREHLLNVPYAPTRRFLSRKPAAALHDDLTAWGCQAHLERAEIGAWQTT